MKSKALIRQYMTPMPYSVTPDFPVREALELMHMNRIQHMPVEQNGLVVGTVSERDLLLALTLQDTAGFLIKDVGFEEAFRVSPDALLVDVVTEMAYYRKNSALVGFDKEVLGIFTATDALRLLGSLLTDSPFKIAA